MTPIITPLYAVLLCLLYIVLSARIIVVRRSQRISLGFGQDDDLQRRVRTHGNFAEYVPFALLLLLMAELRGAGAYWLHGLGILLVVGRLAHAYALSRTPPKGLRWRTFGVLATFTAMLAAAVLIIATA